ncbi:MAG: type II toxin-antitoxin system RelE/ParE family toxin [Endomicrobium sp.]|uniref:type II toxin-antitoxin system RelE/ParE family toxin n=1 Tax=Candidatus Endomicrobiellum pyrsonymphae TaxID=1408203 RepID=UPI003582C5E3|nr:type II toxin-antitoxin system RelE/ParE family toxin [Endomicrobium sp.]
MKGALIMQIRNTEVFKKWLKNLDAYIKLIVLENIDKLEKGNFSNIKSVGGGIHELKIYFQKGYRIYFTNIDGKIIILLCGGNKSSQQKDIEKARKIKECL